MPSVSQKQHNLMAAVANNPAFAKKAGVPQSVGADFVAADKGKKFGGGPRSRVYRQVVNKPETRHGDSALFSKGGGMKESKAMVGKELTFMKKKGAPKSMIKHEAGEMSAMKKGGGVKKMASGGFTRAADGVAQRGKTKAMQVKMKRGGAC
jgi:hypothetical protein